MEGNFRRMKAFKTLNEDVAGSAQTRELVKRLREGREKFGAIARVNVNAALQLSSLNLELGDKSDKIIRYGNRIADNSHNIRKDLSETMNSTNNVMTEQESLSNTLTEVASNSNAVLESLQQNKEALNKMEKICVESADESQVMKEDMAELQRKIGEVKSAVMNINSISNQINLLSLNASVEAARAGSAGKGFGVVAREIHTLYEATTVMIAEMEKSLQNIGIASDRTVSSVGTTAKSLENIRQHVTAVVERNEDSGEKIDQVVTDISSIAETSAEISSSINEIVMNMNHLEGETDELLKLTDSMGLLNNELMTKIITPIQALEEKLDESTALIGEMNRDKFYMLDNKIFIESMEGAVQAHKKWVSTLKLIVESQEIVPLQSDPRKCGFGHFYYAINPQRGDIVSIWKSVEKPHSELHGLGELAVTAVNSGDYGSLPGLYERAFTLSTLLIEKFQEMIRLSQEYEKKGLSVFDMD